MYVIMVFHISFVSGINPAKEKGQLANVDLWKRLNQEKLLHDIDCDCAEAWFTTDTLHKAMYVEAWFPDIG